MSQIADALNQLQQDIQTALLSTGRSAHSARLLAVSKTMPATAIAEAYAAGQRAFGENYVQEALQKMPLLAQLNIEWHHIGLIQSNKTAEIAAHFAWVHGVDRLKIAQRLSAQRPPHLPPLKVCLQVNVSGEVQKSGCTPNALPALAHAVSQLPRLQLMGLMALPEPLPAHAPAAAIRAPFALLNGLAGNLAAQGVLLPELSMGMSADFAAAIAEGATIVRVGSALFGKRH